MNNWSTENKIVLFGPYIGDWKEEILSFRPLVRWIYNNIEFKDYYLSTHFNRKFLYNFIEDENFYPVYESLTRNENKQKNAIHKDIKTKEYSSIILKKTRDDISKKTKVLKKNIIQYGLSYTKARPNFSILNKSFESLPYNKDEKKKKIIFIPDKTGNLKTLNVIMEHLIKNYPDDHIVIGDNKIHFQDTNIIKKRIDYLEIVYESLIDYLSNAKLIICPCSHWTILANQQNTPVFSWGYGNLSIYKSDGVYGFGNKNSIISIQKSLINKKITDHIDYVINEIV